MIPLKDKNPTHRVPVVNISIIVLNVVAFLYELSLGPELESFFYVYGVVPNTVSTAFSEMSLNGGVLISLFSSMFLHGGFLHLGGNMLYLWVFGDNVEDKLGHGRYALFYILCGLGATVAHIVISPNSPIPTVGASGAISGVLGAYLLMFPRARVVTVIPIFFFLQVAELPALVVLGLWFVLQFFNGLASLGPETAGMGGVAWWAHIGGFVAGLGLVLPFRKFR
ncbi:MAG: rhomboid family intramembrane serine protease [Ignavibacteriae bacterium]|nr:rhomboid family intramembrane serine protease [Ignavibacteriota bacterium]